MPRVDECGEDWEVGEVTLAGPELRSSNNAFSSSL